MLRPTSCRVAEPASSSSKRCAFSLPERSQHELKDDHLGPVRVFELLVEAQDVNNVFLNHEAGDLFDDLHSNAVESRRTCSSSRPPSEMTAQPRPMPC